MSDELTQRYARAEAAISAAITAEMDATARMQVIVDALWDEFGAHRPVSWVGFYLMGDREMVLGPRRDKPACSPIRLHGACGTAVMMGGTLIVPDVRELGEAYIACDPRDLSEIVVPIITPEGCIPGVLDVDSHAVGAFGETDQRALEGIIARHLAGFFTPAGPERNPR